MHKKILEKLYSGKNISYKESKKILSLIINKKISSEEITAFLISMKIKNEQPEEIAGAITAILNKAKFFPRPDYLFADIVGTGGDYKNSINISTISAFIASGCGIHIAKHNNKSISSISGSADLLEKIGIKYNMSAEKSRKCLDIDKICFLFAPQYHCVFKQVINIRKNLKTRTLFNVIGPLINPSKPPIILLGVYDAKLILPIAQTLKILKYKRAAIVHSGGMDEITLHSNIQVAELKNNNINLYSLSPEDFGLKYYPLDKLIINSVQENFDITLNILQGKGNIAHESVISANVALLLKLFGNENLRKNAMLALDNIRSGEAYLRIMSLVKKGKNE